MDRARAALPCPVSCGCCPQGGHHADGAGLPECLTRVRAARPSALHLMVRFERRLSRSPSGGFADGASASAPPPKQSKRKRVGICRDRAREGGGGGGNYWAPLPHKRHPLQPAQPRHANHWAPRTRKRHQQEHRLQWPSERSDPTQQVKGRTSDWLAPSKETTTRRNVTQGGGGVEGTDTDRQGPVACACAQRMRSTVTYRPPPPPRRHVVRSVADRP